MASSTTTITCETCGKPLTDADERRTGMCTDDLSRWFAETVGTAQATLQVPYAAIHNASFGTDPIHELTVEANEDAARDDDDAAWDDGERLVPARMTPPSCLTCNDTGWVPGDAIHGIDTRCCCAAGWGGWPEGELVWSDQQTKRQQTGMAGER